MDVTPASYGAFHALSAVRVHRDGHAIVVRGVDDGFEFIHFELRVLSALGEAQYAAGRGEFDEVRAVFVTLAYRLARVVDAVDDAFLRSRIFFEFQVQAIGWIGVAASCGERFARAIDARPDDPARVDCATQRDRVLAVIAEIAYGGEAGE